MALIVSLAVREPTSTWFSLKPEEHQPSGTVNFSRIDNATLQFAVHPGTFQAIDPETGQIAVTTARVRIYAVNYNVLRIMSGMDRKV
jgi:hypothetical protein